MNISVPAKPGNSEKIEIISLTKFELDNLSPNYRYAWVCYHQKTKLFLVWDGILVFFTCPYEAFLWVENLPNFSSEHGILIWARSESEAYETYKQMYNHALSNLPAI